MSRQNKQKKKAVLAKQVTAAHKAGNRMTRTLKLHKKRKTKSEYRIPCNINLGGILCTSTFQLNRGKVETA